MVEDHDKVLKPHSMWPNLYFFEEYWGWRWPMKIQHKLQILALLSSKHTSRSKKGIRKKALFIIYLTWLSILKNLLQHIINLNVLKILGPLYFLLSLKSQVIFTSVTSQFGPVAFQRLGNPCVNDATVLDSNDLVNIR